VKPTLERLVRLNGSDALRVTVEARKHGHTVIAIGLRVRRWDGFEGDTAAFSLEPGSVRPVAQALAGVADWLEGRAGGARNVR
jgi:hypothetical protein